jgi:hypothetical protein
MSSNWAFEIGTSLSVREVAEKISEGMCITQRVVEWMPSPCFTGRPYYILEEGSKYSLTASSFSPDRIERTRESEGLDINMIVHFDCDRDIDFHEQQEVILIGVLIFLETEPGDGVFRFNDVEILIRKQGRLYVNSAYDGWTDDQLALISQPYELIQISYS